jgi:hypothetical protein
MLLIRCSGDVERSEGRFVPTMLRLTSLDWISNSVDSWELLDSALLVREKNPCRTAAPLFLPVCAWPLVNCQAEV